MKKFYIELLVENSRGQLYNPCGTDYNIMYKDLKTLKGVISRMKKWYPFNMMEQEVIGFKIYTYHDLYDINTYQLACESYKGEELFNNILQLQNLNSKVLLRN